MTEPETEVHGTIRILGGNLSYRISGEGPPIVLLHKLGGRMGEWRQVVSALAVFNRVVAIDLPGHGGTTMDGAPPFVVAHEATAAAVTYALEMMGIDPPYGMVGSSIGVTVALSCAAYWPQRVGSLVSLGAAFGSGKSLSELRGETIAAVARGEYSADDSPAPRTIASTKSLFGVEDDAVAEEMNRTRLLTGAWVAPWARGAARCDSWALFAQVTAPVTLAYGERGNYGVYVEEARRRALKCSVVTIPDSGAFPHEEAPRMTVDVIRAAVEAREEAQSEDVCQPEDA